MVLAKRAFELSLTSWAKETEETFQSAWLLAAASQELGEYEVAEEYFLYCLDLNKASVGARHPDTAGSLTDLASLYIAEGRLEAAFPLYVEALSVLDESSDPRSVQAGQTMNSLAFAHYLDGNHRVAATKFARALDIFEERLGSSHTDTVAVRENLIEALESSSQFAKAIPLGKKVLSDREKVFGFEHPATATSLNNLAGLYASIGEFEKALPLYERALGIRENVLGPEHPSTANSLNNLALLYKSMGDYRRALALLERALASSEKVPGPEHPATATSLDNLAALYDSIGEFEKALPLHERALGIREKVLGPEDPSTATSLNNLALLYGSMGDYQQALPLCKRALAIREKALGPEHPDTALSLNNLAGLHRLLGDYQQALLLNERALAIYERVCGLEHPSTATSLNNLATTYALMGNYQLALQLFERALAIREKVFGLEHSDTATSVSDLAVLYKSMGDYQQALPLYQRALAIKEKALGPEHPDTATSLSNLAILRIDLNTVADALSLAERGETATLSTTSNIFTFASERQRLAYQERQHPFDLFGTLASAPNLIRQALRYKGLVLDSMVEDLRLAEASDDPTTRDLAAKVKTVKSELNNLVFDTPTNLSPEATQQRRDRENELKTELERLQGALARAGTRQATLRRAFTITPNQVQDALSLNSALIEFLRYRHYLGKDKWENRYGAVILPKSGEAIWAPLPGKAEDLEVQIAAYKALVRKPKMPSRFALATNAQEGDQIDASLLLPELYNKVWAPVQKALPPGTKTVVISPDGELNFVSLATLITPQDTFLAEEYNITYVSSGRDLVAENEDSPNEAHLLVGNPSFGSEVKGEGRGLALSRALDTRDLNEMNFAQLPHTLTECQGLEEFYQKRKQKVTTLLDDSATEARVRQAQAPQTLHLATHGYFLPEPEANRKFREQARKPGRQEPTLPLKDPMFRSGLALTGAQTTVNLRAKGENPDMKNDGLLTAAEVGLLNLKGTKLVTLSACDTGSGESRAGEGVLGLRRGFVQAGARNLILTLWPVADKETAQLMQEFYAEADSKPAPLAMAEVQRRWLVELRKKKSLSEAVRLAGPFLLSFQGRMR